jgi:hypothetical protein
LCLIELHHVRRDILVACCCLLEVNWLFKQDLAVGDIANQSIRNIVRKLNVLFSFSVE